MQNGNALFDVVVRTNWSEEGYRAIMARLGTPNQVHLHPLPSWQQPTRLALSGVGAQRVLSALVEHGQRNSANDRALFTHFFPTDDVTVWVSNSSRSATMVDAGALASSTLGYPSTLAPRCRPPRPRARRAVCVGQARSLVSLNFCYPTLSYSPPCCCMLNADCTQLLMRNTSILFDRFVRSHFSYWCGGGGT
jgi:hypothetical protein